VLLLLALALTALSTSSSGVLSAQAGGSCALATNLIVCENNLPGNPASDWDVVGAGDPSIQGFSTDISVNRGQTVRFKIATNASSYRLDIYRLGYYSGLGGRKVATVQPSAQLPQSQPPCLSDPTTGLVDCGTWAQSATWAVPATATSGVYLAKLVRTDTGGASQIVFIVRDDDNRSDILFQTSDTTWQAYNSYGGNSLYVGAPAGRANKVSYNRPMITRGDFNGLGLRSFLFNAEYPMIRWLEANGYNVSYFTGVDSDRRGAEIREHKVFLSVGHDEYWSGGQRANVEAARAAGVNLAFLSGNEVFWKTRWENSIDGSGTSYRTLVSYKETHSGAKVDPLPNVWTGTWRDPRFSPPADGGRPENALTGTGFVANDRRYDPMTVPAIYGRLRFWRNTSVATLPSGAVANFAAGILGHEWDEDVDNAFRPQGLIHLSSTTLNIHARLLDYGSSYGASSATHNLTMYRHPSGALVFGAGTVQWSWGLDTDHDIAALGPSAPDPRIQQATVNFLADMGAQPLTLQSGLVPATASTDSIVPASTITFPAQGAAVESGKRVTIRGITTDGGGGVVAGVEVSLDGGLTWRPAVGNESWTYEWTPMTGSQSTSVTIMARAVDDSANLETTPATATVAVLPDTHGPTISAVQVSAAMSTWATVSWTTDELADSEVEYGSTTGYGARTPAATPVTSHSVILTGLTPNSDYHYRVASTDSVGNRSASADFTFRTATVDTTQTITFDDRAGQDQELTGVYPFGLIDWGTGGWYHSGPWGTHTSKSLTYSSSSLTSASFAFITSLRLLTIDAYNSDSAPATVTVSCPRQPTAQVTVEGGEVVTIATGWTSACSPVTLSATNSWGTLFDNLVVDSPPDLVEPLISQIVAGPTAVTATINWLTDEPGDTQVQFGRTTAYGATTPVDPTPRATHAVLLTGLTPSTSYHYRVLSRDVAGNLAVSGDLSFTTAAPDTTAPVISSISARLIAVERATIAWRTDELADGRIEYGTTTSYGFSTSVDPALITAHSQVLTGLLPETLYHYRVSSRDPSGNLTVSPDFTFTTAAPRICPCSIWGDAVVPTEPWHSENGGVELGVRFLADVDGMISGIRFYKGGGNNGPHVGKLWSATGQLLATVTFSGESASGWQQALFSAPVSVVAGTTYVASYHTDTGFAFDLDYFDTRPGVESAPLHALGNGVDGPNGIYRMGPSGFPTQSYRGGNYWVDVVFQPMPDGAPPVITQVSTSAVTTNQATISWSTDEWATRQIEYGTTSALGTATPEDVRLRKAHSVVLSNLVPGTVYQYRVRSRDASGNSSVSTLFSFNTQPDFIPPVISNVSSLIGSVNATVLWTTDEGADGRVEYGTSSAYGVISAIESGPLTSHRVVLGGLQPETQYHYRVLSRDAGGNVAVSADSTFTTAVARGCPCSTWDETVVPAIPWWSEVHPFELGLRFRTDLDGTIAGVRFYKGSGNNGPHVGNLWTAGGQLLATVTFSQETAVGWQQALFSTPVAVTAGTTYVVSYHTTSGFAVDFDYFDTRPGVDNAPLHALGSGVGELNGVYTSGASAFPTSTYRGSNYWVDVVFQPAADGAPPLVTQVTSSQVTLTQATIAWNTNELATSQVEYGLTAALGSSTPDDQRLQLSHAVLLSNLAPNTVYYYRVRSRDLGGSLSISPQFTFRTLADVISPTITNVAALAGSNTAQITWQTNEGADSRVEYGTTPSYGALSPLDPVARTSHSVTLTGLLAGTQYYYRVLSRDAAANLAVSSGVTFITGAARACPCSLWDNTATPAVPWHPDTQPFELGVRFRTDVNGSITGVRFYKGAGNNGPHTGHLWTASGQLLGTVTFTGESASGWQQALFAAPVQVTAGTTYVVSYFTSSGFAFTFDYFTASGVDNAPLHVSASGIDGLNGVFSSGSSGFPTLSYQGSNYWVDVLFQPQ
jgi:phosphodiesterase/alkaline phosphatase D-like protein